MWRPVIVPCGFKWICLKVTLQFPAALPAHKHTVVLKKHPELPFSVLWNIFSWRLLWMETCFPLQVKEHLLMRVVAPCTLQGVLRVKDVLGKIYLNLKHVRLHRLANSFNSHLQVNINCGVKFTSCTDSCTNVFSEDDPQYLFNH